MSQIKSWVSKPLFGREGLGVMVSSNFSSFDQFAYVTEENFGRNKTTNEKLGKSIYQAFTKLPGAQQRTIQASGWVINGMPAGISFREGKLGSNFGDDSPFLLHEVKKQSGASYRFQRTSRQASLRSKLYGSDNSYLSIYSKNQVSPRIVDVAAMPKTSEGLDSVKYTDWNSYRNLTNAAAPARLAEADISTLRGYKCQLESSRSLQTQSAAVAAFLKEPKNRNFQTYRRYQNFGDIGRRTFLVDSRTGGARWYSVDRHGYVRVHYWYTMGYGRSWGRS